MNSFSLVHPEQRTGCLYQYCWYGEPLLLSAVAHIWDSLAEPRELRCALSARPAAPVAALVNMLNQMLCARRTGCGTSPFLREIAQFRPQRICPALVQYNPR